MSRRHQLQDGTGIILTDDLGRTLLQVGSTVPADATQGYAPGAIFLNTAPGSGTGPSYTNIGSATSCLFRIDTTSGNTAATTDPLATSDNTAGYSPGTVWVNTAGNRVWVNISNATGAAVWALTSQNLHNFRNVLDGGDFNVNPWQRATAPSALTGTTTPTYNSADRWFFACGNNANSITVAKTADTTVPGFSNSITFSRTNGNTDNTHTMTMGQIVESFEAIQLQGQQVCLSFWLRKDTAGNGYTGGPLTVQLISGTTADEGAATAISGYTGAANVINTTVTPTGAMTRVSFTGTVPAGCKELALLLSWTGVGTAGDTHDALFLNGFQLEVGALPSPFEFRDPEVELALCQRFYFQLNETNGGVFAIGGVTGTNTQAYPVYLPVSMRIVPTVTVTAGGFSVQIDGAAATAVVTFAGGATHSLSVINATAANTVSAAAHNLVLVGTNTTGRIKATADL